MITFAKQFFDWYISFHFYLWKAKTHPQTSKRAWTDIWSNREKERTNSLYIHRSRYLVVGCQQFIVKPPAGHVGSGMENPCDVQLLYQDQVLSIVPETLKTPWRLEQHSPAPHVVLPTCWRRKGTPAVSCRQGSRWFRWKPARGFTCTER